jgi:hypothetical protein
MVKSIKKRKFKENKRLLLLLNNKKFKKLKRENRFN